MRPNFYHYQLDEAFKPSFKDEMDKLPEGFTKYSPPNSDDELYYKAENSKTSEVIIVNKNGRDYSDSIIAKFCSLLPF